MSEPGWGDESDPTLPPDPPSPPPVPYIPPVDVASQVAAIDAGTVPQGKILYKFFTAILAHDDPCCVGSESLQQACAVNQVILYCLSCGEQRTCTASIGEIVM